MRLSGDGEWSESPPRPPLMLLLLLLVMSALATHPHHLRIPVCTDTSARPPTSSMDLPGGGSQPKLASP